MAKIISISTHSRFLFLKIAVVYVTLCQGAFVNQRHGSWYITSTAAPFLYSSFLEDPDVVSSQKKCVANSAVLNISYAGCHFHGWSAANHGSLSSSPRELDRSNFPRLQRSRRGRKNRRGIYTENNPRVRSVEGVIRRNIAKFYGNVDPRLIMLDGCSRTDKGVHARSLIARFYSISDTEEAKEKLPIPFGGDIGKIQFALNRMLPPDVRVSAISLPPWDNFHPTLDTITKTYQYTFSIGPIHDPLRWRYVWHLPNSTFDIVTAQKATRLLTGRHNFKAFKAAYRGSERKHLKEIDPICNMHSVSLDMEREKDDWAPTTYTLTIKGNRFLYKMVRFMVGTVVACGLNKVNLEDVKYALEKSEWDEKKKGEIICAPAHGLTLVDVDYGDEKGHFKWVTSNR